jgi:hypothetical protein
MVLPGCAYHTEKADSTFEHVPKHLLLEATSANKE